MSAWQVRYNGSWVDMPAPANGGMAIADEPIWSSNTGRGVTGLMTGDIVAWKKTLDLEFAALTYAQAVQIRDVLRGAGEFFLVRFKDSNANAWTQCTMYTSNLPRTIYSLAPSCQIVTGVRVQLVEQ